ncbi:hypothetical protein EDB84DRAFT_677592 [Lactarius hengduanensis]|nr:hypothetical protein EDB84DRAFT_677592 [Lactarius hengduanensis]
MQASEQQSMGPRWGLTDWPSGGTCANGTPSQAPSPTWSPTWALSTLESGGLLLPLSDIPPQKHVKTDCEPGGAMSALGPMFNEAYDSNVCRITEVGSLQNEPMLTLRPTPGPIRCGKEKWRAINSYNNVAESTAPNALRILDPVIPTLLGLVGDSTTYSPSWSEPGPGLNTPIVSRNGRYHKLIYNEYVKRPFLSLRSEPGRVTWRGTDAANERGSVLDQAMMELPLY